MCWQRDDLIRLGFKFDNVVMEEAGQALDIESFIPLMLQPDDETGMSRLKRVVLIGYVPSDVPMPARDSNDYGSDHNQLPPVVQNSCLSRYSHLDQSLFTRLVRLQVPTIELNAQGRCRYAPWAGVAWWCEGDMLKMRRLLRLCTHCCAYSFLCQTISCTTIQLEVHGSRRSPGGRERSGIQAR